MENDVGNDVKIKVMTFNIHHGKGIDGKLNMKRIIQVIKESEADVIGLNEVDRHFSNRSDYVDQVSYLAKHLQMYSAFGASYTLRSRRTAIRRQFGNAVLSRFPIEWQQNHLFDFYAGIIEGRSLLEVNLQINQQQLKLFVTHLSLNPILHKKQTDLIINKIVQTDLPVIIFGDWNMRPKTIAWKKITNYLTDVGEVADENSLYTFPSFHPKAQLDYIFVSKDFQVIAANAFRQNPAASDHLPLIATLIINQ